MTIVFPGRSVAAGCVSDVSDVHCVLHGFPPLMAVTPLPFLQMITGTDSWNVFFLPGVSRVYPAILRDVCHQEYEATIEVSHAFRHTSQSLSRVIAHELFELSLHELWCVESRTLAEVPDSRRSRLESDLRLARDTWIESRLSQYPYWRAEDSIPLPRDIPGWS